MNISDLFKNKAAPRKIKVSAATHNGMIRPENEDNFSLDGNYKKLEHNVFYVQKTMPSDSLLLEVCDGMGGEENGGTAAEIAVQLSGDLSEELRLSGKEDIAAIVNRYVNRANEQICRMLLNNEASRGGSTFALVYIRNGEVYPFSLGDSRIYLYSHGVLKTITTDHTLAMRKYKANVYTLEEAERSPDSHKLTLFLGVDVDGHGLTSESYAPFELKKGEKILICSDGLYDMCGAEEIAHILSGNSSDYSKELLRRALENGGIDNVTCLVAQMI